MPAPGWTQSEETRAKIGEAMRQRWDDPDARAKLQEAQRRSWTAERRAAHSEKLRATHARKRAERGVKTMPVTEETRRKWREAQRRRRARERAERESS